MVLDRHKYWIHSNLDPECGNLEEQGFGWKGAYETGTGAHAITSGLEVTWTTTPTQWSNDFFKHLFEYEWELTASPAGAKQWQPKNGAGGRRRQWRPGPPRGGLYACADSEEKFARDFVAAWDKVMNLDRFDRV